MLARAGGRPRGVPGVGAEGARAAVLGAGIFLLARIGFCAGRNVGRQLALDECLSPCDLLAECSHVLRCCHTGGELGLAVARIARQQAIEQAKAGEDRLQYLERTVQGLKMKRATQIAEQVEDEKDKDDGALGEDTMEQIETTYIELAELRNKLARLQKGSGDKSGEIEKCKAESETLRGLMFKVLQAPDYSFRNFI